ncbi:hypothetical protein Sango_2621000 [Sesamum angolense]|uniref:DUF7733 domain-containing protein n=1 Tax=Sesamum angolense TaxID=2727404 RepID=A0AAE1W1G6_9LAMI|nr:hypothetical protein Sango_2621000 [Sesamum angolense]
MPAEIGPSSDTTLPGDQEPYEAEVSNAAPKPPPPTRRSSLTFHHLNTLAVAVVLTVSGLVSVQDFAFVIFSIIYMYFISKVAFPPTSPHSEPPVFGENNRILGFYVLVAAVIGLFLPIAYIIEGVFEGDKEGIYAAAPHLFLLCSQVLMEGISFLGNFSLPIRVFVPVFYNSKRIFTIVEWLRSEMSRGAVYGGSAGRLYTGRALAVANMGLWCFNLFGFLLPVFLPKAFRIYYSKTKIKD